MKQEQQFLVAARSIMKKMVTPDRFLEFLTECMGWINSKQQERNNEGKLINRSRSTESQDASFMVNCLIQDVVIPWMRRANPEEVIANGLSEVYESFCSEGFIDSLSYIMSGFSYELSMSVYQKDRLLNCYNGLSCLFLISAEFSNITEKKKISIVSHKKPVLYAAS